MSRLILVRHAQSEANRDGVSLGRADSPLTELGLRQAAALGEALAGAPLERVLASPLRRARDTARAIATHHGLEVETHDDLTEMAIGELEGLPWAELRERYADFLREWLAEDAVSLKMPGGESLADVDRRAWPVIAPIFAQDGDGTIVVVSHNWVIRVLICRALDVDVKRWRQFEVDLASRSVFDCRESGVVMRSLNDACHLTPDLVAPAPNSQRR
ncbi:MAG: histidine phosphatase family protein [Dehalococcoidia bacterium]